MANSFGSGFAQGFTSTFSVLEAAEARKKADERAERALKIQEDDFKNRQTEFQNRQTERAALRAAIAEMPTGDTVQVPTFEGMTGGFDQQDAPMRPQAISPDQRRTNFRQRAVSLGADPIQVQQFEAGDLQMEVGRQSLKKGGLEVKRIEREISFDEKFDKVMGDIHQQSANRLREIDTVAQTGGMKGLVEKFGPELKKAFGADVQLVGNNIVVKAKGQKPQTITSLEQATQALQSAAQMEFGNSLETRMIREGLFKNPQELVTYFQNRREAARKDRDTDSQIEYRKAAATKDYAAAGYYNRGGASANRQTQGEIVNEKIDAYASVLMKADPNLSRADAEKRAAQVIMRDPEAKPEMTPADINSFLKDQAGAVVEVDKKTGKPVRLGDLPLDEQLAIARRSLGRGGMPGAAGGLPDANTKTMEKPGSAAPAKPAAPQGAIPFSQRLATAAQADSQRTDKFNFKQFSDEVVKQAPALEAQLRSLRSALPSIQNPDVRAKLEAQALGIERDLELVPGIMEQRKALGL